MSWDILDFGLSYVRSKQKADEVLIAEERKRRLLNQIVEDVRTAYWRAVSSERLMAELRVLENEIEGVLQTSARAVNDGRVSPLASLTYQRELLTIKEEIQDLTAELAVAKSQLAALMNINPGETYKLEMPDREEELKFDVKLDDMITIALENRPELREISYQQRINEQEANAAILDLLPSLKLYGGFNYDSNDFLYNNHFGNWGTRASYNVVQAFRYPVKKKTVAAKQELLEQRELALTMAVVTQVHVSRTRFELAKRKASSMAMYHHVQSEILGQVSAGYKSKSVSKQAFIRKRMNALVAEAKYDIAVADLQNAHANIFSSMGISTFGTDFASDDSVNVMADKFEAYWQADASTPDAIAVTIAAN